MAGLFPQVIQNLQGLQGLEQGKMQMDKYKAQQADMQEASTALQDYYKTGNQQSLINATLKSPQLAGQMLTSLGLDDERKQKQAATDVAELWQLRGNPDEFRAAIAKKADNYLMNRSNPSNIINLGMAYDKDPKQAEMMLQSVGAGLEASGFKTGIFGDAQSNQTPSSQKEFEYYQQLQKSNPEAAKQFARAKGYIETGKEAALTPQERNISTYKQMVAKGDPDAENFGISSGILTKEGRQMDAATTKALQDSMTESESNSANVYKYIDLAERFKASDIQGGILGTGGSWREAAKAALGSQDEVTKLTSEWQKIRSGEAIASLPQGPATDADIRLALKPLPENANAEYMDKYLRGLAKMAQYKAEFNQAKADFISENGSLRAKDGTNFGKVWASKRKDVLDRIAADERFMIKKLSPQEFLGSGNQEQPPQPSAQPQGGFKILSVRGGQ